MIQPNFSRVHATTVRFVCLRIYLLVNLTFFSRFQHSKVFAQMLYHYSCPCQSTRDLDSLVSSHVFNTTYKKNVILPWVHIEARPSPGCHENDHQHLQTPRSVLRRSCAQIGRGIRKAAVRHIHRSVRRIDPFEKEKTKMKGADFQYKVIEFQSYLRKGKKREREREREREWEWERELTKVE